MMIEDICPPLSNVALQNVCQYKPLCGIPENKLFFISELGFSEILELDSSIKPKIFPRSKQRLELIRSLYGVNLVLLDSEILLVNNVCKKRSYSSCTTKTCRWAIKENLPSSHNQRSLW